MRILHDDSTAPARGFTIIELMLVVVVIGLVLGLATWSMQSMLVGSRVSGAGRNLLLHVRQAAAIAARTNAPADLVFINQGSGCIPRYELRGADGSVYQDVCMGRDYPGLQWGGGPAATTIHCTEAPVLLPKCSLCAAGGTKTIRVLPSGETAVSGAGTTGDSIVFSPANDPSPARTIAVGIYETTGRARIFRPKADNSGWECP